MPSRSIALRLLAAASLVSALAGCATYDYVGGEAPGGYYRGQSAPAYGSDGYYGGYGNYGPGYYGYPGYYVPGYYRYYGGSYYYRPPVYYPHRPPHDHDHDDGDGHGDRPPPTGGSHGSPSPWRDLERIGQRQQQRRDSPQGPQPRTYVAPVPRGNAPQPVYRAPRPQASESRPVIQPGFRKRQVDKQQEP